MWQETASHFPAETFGFGVHNWLLKVCFANFFIIKSKPISRVLSWTVIYLGLLLPTMVNTS